MESIIVVLEMFDGLALSIDESTTVVIFETCARHFGTFVKLLELYHSYPDVELYIMQIFRNLIKLQSTDSLNSVHKNVLYKSVHELIQIYCKNEVGRHRAKNISDDDEEDVSVLIEILSGLITAEYEGYERDTVFSKIQNSNYEVDVATVVFTGVNSLLPLITKDMLEFPRLCNEYMSLVNLLIEYFPDRLATLPSHLLNSLVDSLLFGSQVSLGRISDYSYKAIQLLALYAWSYTSLRIINLI
jgi:hypothetical protein